MNNRERAVGMPVFLGALRARLILGVDDRVLFFVAMITLLGIFAPILFLLSGLLFGIGRIVGAVSPYFFDEISVYFNWRIFSWSGHLPDDTMLIGPDPKFVKAFKRAKS
jgi:hypothetical protein